MQQTHFVKHETDFSFSQRLQLTCHCDEEISLKDFDSPVIVMKRFSQRLQLTCHCDEKISLKDFNSPVIVMKRFLIVEFFAINPHFALLRFYTHFAVNILSCCMPCVASWC